MYGSCEYMSFAWNDPHDHERVMALSIVFLCFIRPYNKRRTADRCSVPEGNSIELGFSSTGWHKCLDTLMQHMGLRISVTAYTILLKLQSCLMKYIAGHSYRLPALLKPYRPTKNLYCLQNIEGFRTHSRGIQGPLMWFPHSWWWKAIFFFFSPGKAQITSSMLLLYIYRWTGWH